MRGIPKFVYFEIPLFLYPSFNGKRITDTSKVPIKETGSQTFRRINGEVSLLTFNLLLRISNGHAPNRLEVGCQSLGNFLQKAWQRNTICHAETKTNSFSLQQIRIKPLR